MIQQQQNAKYNPTQQNMIQKQPNYMPGLPHKQLGAHRPTSPLLNGAKFNPTLQNYNNFPTK